MQTAALVFFTASAGTGIIAADLIALSNVGCRGLSALSQKMLKQSSYGGFDQFLLFHDFSFAQGFESCEAIFRCK